MEGPTPKNLAYLNLDMSLRQLLKHMIETKIDYAVLIIPGADMRIAVSLVPPHKIETVTAFMQKTLKP
jgi:hypothetical protein